MVRGVSFRIRKDVSLHLWNILKCINAEQYTWFIDNEQSEEINSSALSEENDIFNFTTSITGEQLKSAFQMERYIIFLKLEAYPINTNNVNKIRIHSYNNFLKSNCNIIFLLYDCEYVEIYSKSASIIKLLYSNAIANCFEDVNYITDENDTRTKMDVRG